MTRYAVLVRGINVGSTRKLPMAELRAALTAASFDEVATYIQSGNIVLSSDLTAGEIAAKVEALIASGFGLTVPVIVRTAAEWSRYAAGSPLSAAQHERPRMLHLCLSARPPLAGAAEALNARAKAGEVVLADGDALWVDFGPSVGTSKLTPALFDRVAGSPVTARNWNSVLAIANLLG